MYIENYYFDFETSQQRNREHVSYLNNKSRDSDIAARGIKSIELGCVRTTHYECIDRAPCLHCRRRHSPSTYKASNGPPLYAHL